MEIFLCNRIWSSYMFVCINEFYITVLWGVGGDIQTPLCVPHSGLVLRRMGGWVLRGLTGTAGQRSSWHWNFTCKTRDTCVKLPHSYILNTQWSSEAFKSAIGQPLPPQMVTYILLLVGAALAHELNITFQNSIVSNLLPHSKQGCRSNQTEKRVRRDFKIGNQGDPGGIQ